MAISDASQYKLGTSLHLICARAYFTNEFSSDECAECVCAPLVQKLIMDLCVEAVNEAVFLLLDRNLNNSAEGLFFFL